MDQSVTPLRLPSSIFPRERAGKFHELIGRFRGLGMPKFVVEYEVPGAGSLTPQQLTAISQASYSVLRKLGSEIQWLRSFVADDRTYRVYIAPNGELVREHAGKGGSG